MSWRDYSAMLFDLDGVITRTAGVHAAAWKRLFDEFLQARAAESGGSFEPFDVERDYLTFVDGRPRYDGVATFLRSRQIELDRGSPDDPPEALTWCGLGNRKNGYFGQELAAQGVEVFADTVELIDVLRAAGKPLAVVSASENCAAILERAGLLDRFDVRVTGVEAARWGLAGKPSPQTFLKAADLLHVRPQESVVFEDAIAGVEAGKGGGFGLVVGVDRNNHPEPLAASGADVVLSDLTGFLRLGERVPGLGEAAHPDLLFEGILVCLPPASEAAGLDEPAVRRALGRLREQRVELVVAGTDPAADAQRLIDRLDRRGIGAGLVLVVGWLAHVELPAGAARTTVIDVSTRAVRDPSTPWTRWVGGGPGRLLALLTEQADRRDAGLVPSIDPDPAWTVTIEGDDPAERRAHQSLLTVSDTRFGTRGTREEEVASGPPRVIAGGVFDEEVTPPTLLEGPSWTSLEVLERLDTSVDRRTLDLRTGVLYREQPAAPVPLRSIRFAAVARPGCFALRAEGAVEWLRAGTALAAPAADGTFARTQQGHSSTGHSRTASGGSIAAATVQSERSASGRRIVERLACFVATAEGAADGDDALATLKEVEHRGFDALLAEQRASWARRWDDATVWIDGDPELEVSVRFGLFHLMATVPVEGEAVVGPRGLAGPTYRGHVFWDADVFTLPFLAATCPSAARAMLEYRVRRLGAARRFAVARGMRGARFPWESARTGVDVTPAEDRTPHGPVIPIYTGEHEEHIVSDVAWAAWQYAAWTGDWAFLTGPGRALVLDTARYWASRVRFDDLGAHIDDVIGPDEYHERVDDNVFTNVMARWNLLRAVDLVERTAPGGPDDVTTEEVASWRHVAGSLVDNFDPDTGLYEQYAGYYGLEPLLISEVAQTPIAADLLLGRARISASQVIKQPDVLMLHHLVPEEMPPDTLRPNLSFYEPRCAHGSSLSPAIHAGLFARIGHPEEALRLFRMACRLDLDNLTGTTAGGLHIATFGGVWQALVFGFAGIRPLSDGLVVDPNVPAAWGRLGLRLRFRGHRVELRATPDSFWVHCDGPVTVITNPGTPGAVAVPVSHRGQRWNRHERGWQPE